MRESRERAGAVRGCSRMRLALVALALVVSACGGDAAPDPSPTTTMTTPVVDSTVVATTAPGATPTTAVAPSTTRVRVRPEGEVAPDFSLALGEGGTFTLSEETRPVFLLFWAEW